MDIKKLIDGISRIKIGLVTSTIDGERIFPYLESAQKTLEKQRWIPVSMYVPTEKEYMVGVEDDKRFRRLEIAVQTDTIEYFIGYFVGYKWFDKRHRGFEGDVVAWKIHQPYKP